MHSIRGAGASAALLLAASGGQAFACSTCQCGDYTITLFGSEKPYAGRLRLGLDTLLRNEREGDPAAVTRETDEWRTLLGVAWNPTPALTLAAQLPWVRKEVDDSDLTHLEAEGFGDLDVFARWTLWQSGGGSGRHLAGVRGGVRLPTSEEIDGDDGEPLDIDVQPDAGATAPNVGLWYGYYRFPWFVTLTANHFAYREGRQDFQPGDATTLSLHAQRGIGQRLALQVGLDLRHAQANRFSDAEDPDSGGSLTMGWLGAAVRLSTDLVMQAGVQLPLIDDLSGHQDEDAVWRASLAFDF